MESIREETTLASVKPAARPPFTKTRTTDRQSNFSTSIRSETGQPVGVPGSRIWLGLFQACCDQPFVLLEHLIVLPRTALDRIEGHTSFSEQAQHLHGIKY
jgi:hypothetical protein